MDLHGSLSAIFVRDDPTAMLPNGDVLCGYIAGPKTYIYDPSNNTWTEGPTKLHNDQSDEETWITLTNGDILSYDIVGSLNAKRFTAQYLDVKTMTWVDASNINPSNPAGILTDDVSDELGPAYLMSNGKHSLPGPMPSLGIRRSTTRPTMSGPRVRGCRTRSRTAPTRP